MLCVPTSVASLSHVSTLSGPPLAQRALLVLQRCVHRRWYHAGAEPFGRPLTPPWLSLDCFAGSCALRPSHLQGTSTLAQRGLLVHPLRVPLRRAHGPGAQPLRRSPRPPWLTATRRARADGWQYHRPQWGSTTGLIRHARRACRGLLNVVSWSIHYACRSVGPTGPAHNHCADRPGLCGLPSTASPVRVPFVLHACRAPQRLLSVLSWCCNGVCTAAPDRTSPARTSSRPAWPSSSLPITDVTAGVPKKCPPIKRGINRTDGVHFWHLTKIAESS